MRVGGVHRAMGYKNRIPLVCSAIGSTLFEDMARVGRLSVDGPLASTTTVIRFEVLP